MFYETEFGAKSSWAQKNSHFAPGVERKYVYEIDPCAPEKRLKSQKLGVLLHHRFGIEI